MNFENKPTNINILGATCNEDLISKMGKEEPKQKSRAVNYNRGKSKGNITSTRLG